MKLHIEHTTTFAYEEPISEAYTEMRLRPLESAGQRCLWFTLTTEPGGEVMHYTDRYGNLVHHFDTLQPHDRVEVKAASEVYLTDGFADDQRVLSPLDQFDYLAPAKYTPMDERIRAFAEPHIVADDQTATALALMRAIYSSLKYERGATDVGTKAPEALALGRGVCQDFAHIMLAACRGAGIPARYVSGYIHRPNKESQSHAWCEAWLPELSWVGIDPTNDQPTGDHFIKVAVGRNFMDVPPMRGVYKGQARETLTVDVSVRAV